MLNFLIVIQIMLENPTGNIKKVTYNVSGNKCSFTDMAMLQEMYFE